MALIPVMRCRDMRVSVAFYTGVLDFDRAGDGNDDPAEHDFITLHRDGHQLALSHDDGVFGTVVVVVTSDVDAVFRLLRRRGLRASAPGRGVGGELACKSSVSRRTCAHRDGRSGEVLGPA